MDRLLAASRAGDAAAIDAIVAANSEALVDAEDERGERPLHLACRSGSTSAVAALLAAGADPNLRNRVGNPPLFAACVLGTAAGRASMRLLLARGADASSVGTKPFSNTALHLAAERADAQAVAILVAAGADTGARNGAGNTPEEAAARIASVTGESEGGAQPAASRGHFHTLHAAAAADDTAALAAALGAAEQSGVDVATVLSLADEATGASALMVAAVAGAQKAATWLVVDAGVSGTEALAWAASRGDVLACRTLIEAGADGAVGQVRAAAGLVARFPSDVIALRCLLEAGVPAIDVLATAAVQGNARASAKLAAAEAEANDAPSADDVIACLFAPDAVAAADAILPDDAKPADQDVDAAPPPVAAPAPPPPAPSRAPERVARIARERSLRNDLAQAEARVRSLKAQLAKLEGPSAAAAAK